MDGLIDTPVNITSGNPVEPILDAQGNIIPFKWTSYCNDDTVMTGGVILMTVYGSRKYHASIDSVRVSITK